MHGKQTDHDLLELERYTWLMVINWVLPTLFCPVIKGVRHPRKQERLERFTKHARRMIYPRHLCTGNILHVHTALEQEDSKEMSMRRIRKGRDKKHMIMIAFITIKSSLVPLIEGLCAQIKEYIVLHTWEAWAFDLVTAYCIWSVISSFSNPNQ